MRLLISAIVVSGLTALGADAQATSAKKPDHPIASSCVNDPSWVEPQKPFRIHGNTWYVGTRGIAALLVTSQSGHVLIDVGVPESASLVEASIRNLGFKLRDIKWVLNSHAHCDHAGGIAQLAHDTGAMVIANAGDIPALTSGGHDEPQYGNRFLFPPLQVAAAVADDERLRLGDLLLAAHLTPGHTKGNTSWTWTSCESGRCLQMAYVGSLSAPDYTLIDNAKYPDIVKDYERGFATVAGLPCDIALAPHPGMVNFWKRVKKREQGDGDALIDVTACRAYAEAAREDFDAELAEQRTNAVPAKTNISTHAETKPD